MPLVRRRRPLLRAAAVGGGAYALGKHRERKQEEQAYYDQSSGAGAPAAAPAPAPAGPSAMTSDDMQRLTELAKLRDQGVLTDEEFASQKAKILGTS